ncbi:MAG: DUF1697 domain-containing protein [Gemmatimonadaceae bacterium]|nr:DUF1697 domain-containing protein [Gemmatimonadaceae bacterium]
MPTHIALLRAVNVTGTGTLKMDELRRRVSKLGYERVRTYIASGNLLADSPKSATAVQRELAALVEKLVGKPVGVFVRSAAALAKTLAANPFPDAVPSRVLVLFLDHRVRQATLDAIAKPGGEEVVAAGGEIFLHFPNGMGQSKLRVPQMDSGTGRNLNTVRKLIAMAREDG